MVELMLHSYHDAITEPSAVATGSLTRTLVELRTSQERNFNMEFAYTTRWTGCMLCKVYSEVAQLIVTKKLELEKLFGTFHESKRNFSRKVLVLFMCKEGNLADIRPKIKGEEIDNDKKHLSDPYWGERHV